MAKETGLRKRSQIKKANQTMFIWVASMSVVAMVCLVVSYHLVLTTLFKGRVISAKAETVGNLQTSIKNTDSSNENGLSQQILALDANENLAMVKSSPEDKALQVILDALPSSANPLSFGASLQKVLLVGPQDLNVKSISVESVSDSTVGDTEEVIEEETTTEGATTDSEGNVVDDATSGDVEVQTDAIPMAFSFVVEGPEISLHEVLQRLEKSIRTIYVDSINIERQGSENEMIVSGHVFYQPEKTAELQEKVVK